MTPSTCIRTTTRRRLLQHSLAVATLGSPLLQAQAQNTAAIKLLVGYAAGGPVDAGARVFAPLLAKALDQTVVVENRPGVSGALAGDVTAKSTPNGLTLFFAASPTMTITPHVVKAAMPFDPLKDLTAVAPLLSYANVLVANLNQAFKTVAELVAHAKANPGKLTYGSAGMGASNHLSGELLAQRTGTQMTHVPYKGNAPAMTDVIGGQISMMFDIIGSARNYIGAGRVRPLAVTSRERNPSLPDVPTLREAGIADYEVGGWYGLYGPNRMPAEVLSRLQEGSRKALASDELKQKWTEQGYELWPGTAQQLADRAARELALWAGVTKGMAF